MLDLDRSSHFDAKINCSSNMFTTRRWKAKRELKKLAHERRKLHILLEPTSLIRNGVSGFSMLARDTVITDTDKLCRILLTSKPRGVSVAFIPRTTRCNTVSQLFQQRKYERRSRNVSCRVIMEIFFVSLSQVDDCRKSDWQRNFIAIVCSTRAPRYQW